MRRELLVGRRICDEIKLAFDAYIHCVLGVLEGVVVGAEMRKEEVEEKK